MALWKDLASKDPAPAVESATPRAVPGSGPARIEPTASEAPRPARRVDAKESVLAPGLSIEGKIEGAGDVRIAGRFKGDIHVDGTLTIEPGAHVVGAVRAGAVVVGGELEGNIEAAARVDVQPTGVINGDVAAGSLTVAAGSRMRGRVEFGWTESARTVSAVARA